MSICWFCEKRNGDHNFEVYMHRQRVVGSTAYQKTMEYKEVTVPIPRCAKCAIINTWKDKKRIYFLLLFFIAIAIAFLYGLVINPIPEDASYWDIMGFVLIWLLSWVVGAVAVEFAIKAHQKKKFPEGVGESKIKHHSSSKLLKHPDVLKMIVLGFEVHEPETRKRNKKNS